MGVGLRLKIALREKKQTIKDFSKESGISINTLYSITKRDTENVDTAILGILSSTLGLSWSFFCSCSPFDDLDFLQKNKEAILLQMENQGLYTRNSRPLSEISNYEFWQMLSADVDNVLIDDYGNIQLVSEPTLNYDPNSEIGADIDKLLEHFTKLEPGGRALVIEYTQLLTSHPGFLLKRD